MPANVRATGGANAVTVDWAAPTGTGPQGQRPIDNYVVEAWQGTTLRGAQAVDGDRRTATLSGLPAGSYEARVRAINGFATGPDGTAAATVTGVATTYAGAVTTAAPKLYWRLGERSGTLLADASGFNHPALLNTAANVVTKPSGLTSDPDSAFGDGRAWYSSSYDLIRAPLAAGLPTGDRTVEALVKADAPGARIVIYGDFSVEVTERGLKVGDATLNLPDEDDRRLTDNKFHHLALTYAGTTLTAYLDGEAIASAQKTLATTTTDAYYAALIPAGANVVYDELAIYDKALDAATIQNHFALSGNPAPADRKAPKPTIEAPVAGTTTTTRPVLKGRLGELPGDVQHVSLKVTKAGSTVVTRELDGSNGAWNAGAVFLPTGELTLEVTQLDQAGNLGKATTHVHGRQPGAVGVAEPR